jgi:hypothetical protein
MLSAGLLGVLLASVTLLPTPPASAADGCQGVAGSRGDGSSASITLCAESPGAGAGGTSGAGAGAAPAAARSCHPAGNPARTIPCSVDGAWWSAQRGCYVERAVPQPPADSPLRQGTEGGAFYRCSRAAALVDGTIDLTARFWLPDPPAAAGPDPAVMAQRAIDSMALRAPAIGLTPPPGSPNPTLVGLPTWMWVADPGPTTWGPVTATATAGAVAVTATAGVSSITWDMGDGTTVRCGPGTPWQPAQGASASPTCGHEYRAPGTYTITATAHWAVDWTGAGQTGRITMPLTTSTTVTVAQAYALVTQNG